MKWDHSVVKDTLSAIEEGLDESRGSLLDLSNRNPLIKFKEQRKVNIKIKKKSSEEIFKSLVKNKKELEIAEAEGQETSNKESLLVESTNLLRDISSIEKKQKAYIRETGVNALFLSLGFLSRPEVSYSEEIIKSPLALIPVEIKKGPRSKGYHLSHMGSEIQTNLSLIEKLKKDYGYSVVPREFPNDEEQELDILDYYFKVIEDIIQHKPEYKNWKLQRDEIYLSFFNFNSFLLYEDLAPKNWINGESIKSSVVSSIFGEGFKNNNLSKFELEEIDFDEKSIPYVSEIDSTQAKALYKVSQGENLVIKGPPGTGKSQTIVNIIASSIKKGKSVLFVTEKLAALKVVKNRMDELGLGEAVLELHSNKTNKASFYNELKSTMSLKEIDAISPEKDIRNLTKLREELNSRHNSMEIEIENTGMTPRNLVDNIVSLRKDISEENLNKIKINNIGYWSKKKFDNIEEILKKYCRILGDYGNPRKNPFYECLIHQVHGRAEFIELHEKIKEFHEHLLDLGDMYGRHEAEKGVPGIKNILLIKTALNGIEFLEKFEKKFGYYYSSSSWIRDAQLISNLISEGRKVAIEVETLDYKLTDGWMTQVNNYQEEMMEIQSYHNRWQRFFNYRYLKSLLYPCQLGFQVPTTRKLSVMRVSSSE